VFNATFSNISAMSWRPILVVEEAGVTGENHREATDTNFLVFGLTQLGPEPTIYITQCKHTNHNNMLTCDGV
jgi:hypothetical protein